MNLYCFVSFSLIIIIFVHINILEADALDAEVPVRPVAANPSFLRVVPVGNLVHLQPGLVAVDLVEVEEHAHVFLLYAEEPEDVSRPVHLVVHDLLEEGLHILDH